MAEKTQKTPRVKLSGLWVHETKDGSKYLCGGKGPRYIIWKNSFKEKDTDPTHILYLEAPYKKDDSAPEERGIV